MEEWVVEWRAKEPSNLRRHGRAVGRDLGLTKGWLNCQPQGSHWNRRRGARQGSKSRWLAMKFFTC